MAGGPPLTLKTDMIEIAIVKKPFKGVPDNESHGRDFKPGDMVEGRLAEVAMREGWAEPTNTTPAPAPEKKTTEPKRGSVLRRGRPSTKTKSS